MISLWLAASAAIAGDLDFNPDRPGVGDSTTTVGAGHLMIEAGVATTFADPIGVRTDAIMARIGVDDGLELRVRVPDLIFAPGPLSVGSVGLGAKIGGHVSRRWSLSAIPEVSVETMTGALAGSLSTNVACDLGRVALWSHLGATVGEGGASAIAGGGVAVPIATSGVYVHGAHTFGAEPFVGAGGWFGIVPNVQLDTRVDLYVGATSVTPVWLAGGSFAF